MAECPLVEVAILDLLGDAFEVAPRKSPEGARLAGAAEVDVVVRIAVVEAVGEQEVHSGIAPGEGRVSLFSGSGGGSGTGVFGIVIGFAALNETQDEQQREGGF
jgi:hypothetical protein